jgi:hypothetical protein
MSLETGDVGRSGRRDALTVEDRAEIHRLHFAEKLWIKTIERAIRR